jgi:hypothetical protein
VEFTECSGAAAIIRRYFLYDRKLLSDLSRCAWDSLEALPLATTPDPDASPGTVIAIQTFGDFLNFNPHCHVLCTDGTFSGSGSFQVAPALDDQALEKLFQHKVLKRLVRKGKITEELVQLIMSWRHSGFNVHCGPTIQQNDEEAMENIGRYVVRASFSQEKMI